jgi:hypothetical protein
VLYWVTIKKERRNVDMKLEFLAFDDVDDLIFQSQDWDCSER